MKKIILFLKHMLLIAIMSLPVVALSSVIWHLRRLETTSFWVVIICIVGVPLLFMYIAELILKIKPISNIFKELTIYQAITQKRLRKAHFDEIDRLVIDKTSFLGVTKKYLRLNFINGIIIDILIITVYVSNYMIGNADLIDLKILIIGIIAIVVISYNYFGKTVTVSPKGIKSKSLFKGQFLSWNQIKSIGISANSEGKSLPSPLLYVYVTTRKIDKKHIMIDEDKKNQIAFKFRPKMIHHILTYWDGEVDNLANVKKWRKYLMKNGITKL